MDAIRLSIFFVSIALSTATSAADAPFGICNVPTASPPAVTQSPVPSTLRSLQQALGQYKVPNVAPLPASIAAPVVAVVATPAAATKPPAAKADASTQSTPNAAAAAGTIARVAKAIKTYSDNCRAGDVLRARACNILTNKYKEAQFTNNNFSAEQRSQVAESVIAQGGPAAAIQPAPGATGTTSTGGLDSGTVLSSVDDFLLTRADDEVTPWLATELTSRFCIASTITPFPNTCATLDGFKNTPASWPSKHALQVALQSDLKLLPVCSSGGFLKSAETILTTAAAWSAAPSSTTNPAAQEAHSAVQQDLPALLLFASFVDNLSQGVPLTNDLIGLGKTAYVRQICNIDPKTGLLPIPTATRPSCAEPFLSMARVSIVLYYGGGLPLSQWSQVVMAGNDKPSGFETDFSNDYVAKLPGITGSDLLLQVTNASHDLNGYLADSASGSSVNWEGAAATVGGIVDLFAQPAMTDAGTIDTTSTTPGKQTIRFDDLALLPTDAQLLFTIDMAAQAHDYNRVLQVAWDATGCQPADSSGPIGAGAICSFANFAVGVANATNEDELVSAMNDASDPAGGWRYKMGADGFSAVTAVVGLSAGRELPNGIYANSGGAFAPVGFAYSHTTSCWSFGVLDTTDCTWLISLFDFGGLYSYSQQNTGPGYIINTTPRSTLASALSLGLSYYHRVAQTPFVYGLTYEYSPDLRTVTYSNPNGLQGNVSTHRILLFFGVDLVLHSIN